MKDRENDQKTKLNELKYDAWLIWNITNKCNLACGFCSARASMPSLIKIIKIKSLGLIPYFSIKKLKAKFKKIPEKIDIVSLIRTLDETNRIFRIGFSGGEPFLSSNIIEACVELTKRHYISLNTNLISKNIKEFTEKIDPERVIHFHASLHIKELERLNLLDRYINNFLLCKEKGFDIFAQEVAYPPLLEEVDKYKKNFKEKGIELTFNPFNGEYNKKIYPQAYTEKEIEIFGLDETYINYFYQKGKICNAGYNVGLVSITGDIQPCHLINKNMGNIYKEIKFSDKVIKCPFEFCFCPMKNYDDYLFKKAIEETSSIAHN